MGWQILMEVQGSRHINVHGQVDTADFLAGMDVWKRVLMCSKENSDLETWLVERLLNQRHLMEEGAGSQS